MINFRMFLGQSKRRIFQKSKKTRNGMLLQNLILYFILKNRKLLWQEKLRERDWLRRSWKNKWKLKKIRLLRKVMKINSMMIWLMNIWNYWQKEKSRNKIVIRRRLWMISYQETFNYWKILEEREMRKNRKWMKN
jgi:hypothetical protein